VRVEPPRFAFARITGCSKRRAEQRSAFRQTFGRRGGLRSAYPPYGFWEHTIRDERNLTAHMDYIHFNPVKHGFVEHPAEWPYSSFHRCVARGLYPAGWIDGNDEPAQTGERQ
jgi:putative transposase